MHDENHKMINSSREEEAANKQGATQTNDERVAISSRLWTSLKNPRIVRVSRSFGGKDRHSKVTTVRGLRDRRVRLSVPTAIQLYDLQDKLGLNQPSKVVDWLINAAQHEIDKLPPLEIPPGNLMHFPQSMPVIFERNSSQKASLNNKVGNANGYLHGNKGGHQDNASSSNFNTSLADDMTMYPKSVHWNSIDHDLMRMKEKEALSEEPKDSHDKGSNMKGNHEVGNLEGVNLMNNIAAMPYNSYYQLEPSTAAYLSYMRSHSLPSTEMHHGYHPISMFTPCMTAATTSLDSKQYGYFQLASFPSENVDLNRHRGYLQPGNSSMMRDLQANDHSSKVQLREEEHQK